MFEYTPKTSGPDRSGQSSGFTLIELVVVIVITGILVTVAMRGGMTIVQTSKMEETKKGMQDIEFAICGNPSLQNNGTRSDFGYVGDVGALPPNLDALTANPGGYATWNGPYLRGRFQQSSMDFEQDAWNVAYQYSGGISVTSTGSGDNVVHAFANSTSDLLYDKVCGTVADRDGLPPGTQAADSITILLSFPNGAGAIVTRSLTPDPSGYFLFDSIPIGTHDLRAIYVPTNDTLKAFVTVLPASTSHCPYRFPTSLWGTGALAVVGGSDTLSGSPSCTEVSFWIVNNSGVTRSITSMGVSWPSPTAYYAQIYWGATLVFDQAGSPRGVSGSTYAFSSPQAIADGEKVKIQIEDFRSTNSNGGDSPVSMSSSTITVRFSDGSAFTEEMPSCP
jgi:prepilin-type N-terminal cleavage/methylation domain-containing protein